MYLECQENPAHGGGTELECFIEIKILKNIYLI